MWGPNRDRLQIGRGAPCMTLDREPNRHGRCRVADFEIAFRRRHASMARKFATTRSASEFATALQVGIGQIIHRVQLFALIALIVRRRSR